MEDNFESGGTRVVVVVLLDPFQGMGVWRNSTEIESARVGSKIDWESSRFRITENTNQFPC